MITMMITKDDDKGDDKKLKDQSRTIQEVQDKNQEEFKTQEEASTPSDPKIKHKDIFLLCQPKHRKT